MMIKLAPVFPGVFQAAHKDQEEILSHKVPQNHSNVYIYLKPVRLFIPTLPDCYKNKGTWHSNLDVLLSTR